MKLNENQHKILALPNIQELINALDLIPHDQNEEVRNKITARVDNWLLKIKTTQQKPRIISSDPPSNDPFSDKAAWIEDQKSIHGEGWCPM